MGVHSRAQHLRAPRADEDASTHQIGAHALPMAPSALKIKTLHRKVWFFKDVTRKARHVL